MPTLNPGGVRIGTAEIYRQVEQLDEVVESLVIGQQWDNDERVVLFVRLRDGRRRSTTRSSERIKRQHPREHDAAPRPGAIVQVPEIPRTKSGKIVELAVRDVVHGREVKNREALANPEALESSDRRSRRGRGGPRRRQREVRQPGLSAIREEHKHGPRRHSQRLPHADRLVRRER